MKAGTDVISHDGAFTRAVVSRDVFRRHPRGSHLEATLPSGRAGTRVRREKLRHASAESESVFVENVGILFILDFFQLS